MPRPLNTIEEIQRRIVKKTYNHIERLIKTISNTTDNEESVEVLKLAMPVLIAHLRLKDNTKPFNLNISLKKINDSGFTDKQLAGVRDLVAHKGVSIQDNKDNGHSPPNTEEGYGV